MADAIRDRTILEIKYSHVEDDEIVVHRVAPFDVGSTNPNPKIRERNGETVYAYSYTHIDDKTNQPDPKVTGFNGRRFIDIRNTGQTFDETELAILNFQSTKYDYRTCNFALLANRDWFK